MKLKKICALALSSVMLTASALGAEITVSVNGDAKPLGAEAVIIDGSTYVAADELAAALGAEIKDGTLCRAGIAVKAEEKEIDGKAQLPLRYVAEGLGATVRWNDETGDVAVMFSETEEGLINNKYYRIHHGDELISVVDGGFTCAPDNGDGSVWFMTKKSDGFYSLLNKANGNSPDVPNAKTEAGVALIQYASNNAANQRFGFVKNDDGSFCINVKHSKLYFTVKDGKIFQEEYTGEANQRFTVSYAGAKEKTVRGVDEALKIAEKPVLEDYASYSITLDGKPLIGIDEWTLVPAEGQSYNLTAPKTALAAVDGELMTGRIKVPLMSFTPSWNGKGFTIAESESGLYITGNGEKFVLDEFKNDETQTFTFTLSEPASAPELSELPMHKAYYKIVSGGKKLALDNEGKIVFNDEGSDWLLLNKDGEYHSVTNKADGLSLDIPSVSTEPGVALISYSAGSGDNQRFAFVKNTDGSYSIIAKHSGLYLTVKDGILSQEEHTDEDNQKFALEHISDVEMRTMGAAALLFLVDGEEKVNNAKIQWNAAEGATAYNVYRSTDGGDYEFITSVTSTMADDYGLRTGHSYKYKVEAVSPYFFFDSAETEAVEPYFIPDVDLNTFSNITVSGLDRPNGLVADGVYYRFSQKGKDGVNGFYSLVMSSSTDDITYGDEVEVLNIDDILADPSSEGLEDCKFESVNYLYNKETGMFYMWAHLEAAGGYNVAKVAVAYGKPGERFKFTCFRPTGDDSRDLNVYVEDDNEAYLMAAINGNADLALYKINDDWTGIDHKITIVNRGRWRELPSVLKKDGIYYMFHSGTAGWYPTQGAYNTATDMEGPWSEMKLIGNTNTFSSQSGGVSTLKKGGNNALMLSYRWMWWWDDATNRTTQNRLMPIVEADGYAFTDFFNKFYYNVSEDILIPVQTGRLISLSKPITATSNNSSVWKTTDGDYMNSWWAENEWPQSVTINLEQVYDLSEMQISWASYNGSETYYNYTVEASLDGINYTTVLDRSEGYTDYAFTVDALSGAAQYVRINMLDVTPRNDNKSAYAPNAYEIRIFGY